MIPTVAGETRFLLRLPPEVYERLRALAERHERSVNWTIARLVKKALDQDPATLDDLMR
jgi:hypothetical protein